METLKHIKKKLGIIGGMGSPAGVWLFKRIIELSSVSVDQEYLDILVHSNSAIPDRTRAIFHGEKSPLPELERSVKIFNENNIDVVIMACMTAHYYTDSLGKTFKGKIINPLDLVIEELNDNIIYLGKKKIGIIGSTGLIKSGIFHKKLNRAGYEAVVLDDDDQETYFMKPIYMKNGIKSGLLREEVLNAFRYQIPLLAEKGAEVIIGACSEVPLVITEPTEVLFIDAFELLARKTVEYCYNKKELIHNN